MERVALRVKFGGHHVPTEIVERRFQRSLKNLFELYIPLADRWVVLDNADGALKPLASGTARTIRVKEKESWQKLKLQGL